MVRPRVQETATIDRMAFYLQSSGGRVHFTTQDHNGSTRSNREMEGWGEQGHRAFLWFSQERQGRVSSLRTS